MSPRFGTDGLRGVANRELTPEVVLALGRAVVRVVAFERAVLGRDTRRSSAMLSAALAAGLASEGVEVLDLGVVPTPVVAHGAFAEDCPGLVVSASHNPFEDNGIKMFATGGLKLDPGVEAAIEAELGAILAGEGSTRVLPQGAGLGDIGPAPGLVASYRQHLESSLADCTLAGLSLVIDCANGAGWQIAPQVLSSLGARVVVLGNRPDGTNINAGCGSTDTSALAAEVVARSADMGLALDGDGDRLVAVDHTGNTLDGDYLMALFAADHAERNMLSGNAIAVTVMSNLGLRRALAARSIDVVETAVGDRNVLDAMDCHGLSLGGEQSGHIIFRRLATTGDGLLTALQLADLVRRYDEPLSELARRAMTKLPQRLVNVVVDSPGDLAGAPAVWEAVRAEELVLGDEGRVLLRPSGTERVVRVMVEASSERAAQESLSRLVSAVEGALSGTRSGG